LAFLEKDCRTLSIRTESSIASNFIKPSSGKYANPTTLRQDIQDDLRHFRASLEVRAVQLFRSMPFAVDHYVPPATASGRSGTIGYELLNSLGARYHRQYIHS
jgi:hypothetical protein